MRDGVTEPTNRLRSPLLTAGVRRGRGWSRMPHHRRRRRFALAGLLVLAVLAAVTLGGSTRTRHAAAGSPPPGFFGRVQTLAGTARNSFAGEQQAALNGAIDRTP